MANHKDNKWRGKLIKRGDRVTSYANLASETTLSIMQVRTALDKLKSTHEITSQSTSEYTVISICNYETYQADNTPDNKRVTNEQQTNNKRVTTNKNDKNVKNENNDKEDKIILSEPSSQGNEINSLIELFKPINPSYKTLYPNTTERKSLERMIKEHGYNEILKVISNLHQYVTQPYAPRITKPSELEKDFGKLLLFISQERNKNASRGIKISKFVGDE